MKPKIDLRGLNENYKEDLFIIVAKCRTLLRKMNYDEEVIREFTLNACRKESIEELLETYFEVEW